MGKQVKNARKLEQARVKQWEAKSAPLDPWHGVLDSRAPRARLVTPENAVWTRAHLCCVT